MTVIPATKHLKVAPFAVLHFSSKTHKADQHGILRDVPHDTAVVLIKNKSAKEATEADLAAAMASNDAPEASATPEKTPAPAKAAKPVPDASKDA